jgi:hypothetical protein
VQIAALEERPHTSDCAACKLRLYQIVKPSWWAFFSDEYRSHYVDFNERDAERRRGLARRLRSVKWLASWSFSLCQRRARLLLRGLRFAERQPSGVGGVGRGFGRRIDERRSSPTPAAFTRRRFASATSCSA